MTAAALAVAGAAATVALTAPAAPADTGAACSAVYTIGWQTPSDSPPDFGVTVTVTNNASFPISGWTVSWNYTGGQKVIAGSPYSANVVQNGTAVTATPGGSYNATLNPGASTTWGFHGTYNGTSNPVPAVTCSGPSQGAASAVLSGPLDPLGVNTASWDTNFVDSSIAGSLSSAHTGLIRYPGGSWADQYMWQTNSVGGKAQPVDFAQYSAQTDAVTDGQKFVTLNYGSDTPASAGAWARQAKGTAGQGVALWEVGNEVYGSWEVDNHADPHTAASYATNALPYMQAVHTADPAAQVCYDYGMDGGLAPGSGVDDWQAWNSTILQADAAQIDCADVHWYPINGVPTESVQSIMELIDNVPAAAAEVKSALATYDPSAYFVVGETNISQTANAWNEQPVGALFSAANALEWLANGAQSVDWWDVHNYGTSTADFGMFSSATGGEPAMDTPLPPYYGYLLASKLAVKGAKVGTLPVSTPNVYGFYSQATDGKYSVLLANADPSNPYQLSTSSLGITSPTQTEYAYSAANPTITTSTATGTSVTVPAYSVVVLSGAGGGPPSTPPSSTPSTPVTSTTPSSTSSTPTTTPRTTPSTSPSSTPSSTGGISCKAVFSDTNDWGSGFSGNVLITNTGAPWTSWTLTFTFPGNQTLQSGWNGTWSQSGKNVTVTSTAWNGGVPTNGTVDPAANFSYSGTTSPPTSFKVNGVSCS
ncbi:MAG: hypothetical protein HOV83_24720 [Catenulispora sp.]|nr:hypothetical protein [Catenulispora sp.]